MKRGKSLAAERDDRLVLIPGLPGLFDVPAGPTVVEAVMGSALEAAVASRLKRTACLRAAIVDAA